MARKKEGKPPLSFAEVMRKLVHAGISGSSVTNRQPNELEEISTLDERIAMVLGIVNRADRPSSNMLFFCDV